MITVPETGRPASPTSSSSLLGVDGNAFGIMGHTKTALKRAGADASFIAEYMTQAMSGDYDNLLAVSMAFLDSGPEDGSDDDYDPYDEDGNDDGRWD